MLSLLIWTAFLHGQISLFNQGLNATIWHIHEMLFGFVAAIIVGFLLTAVQTWTGIASIKGSHLMALVTLWLFARVIMFIITAIIHTVRAVRWRIWVTLEFPLVWSLHISYWCLLD